VVVASASISPAWAGSSRQLTDGQGIVHITNVPADPRYRSSIEATGPNRVGRAGPGRPAAQYASDIEEIARGYALSPALIEAVVRVESFQDSPADEKPHQRYVPAAPRQQLRELLGDVDLRAVISGHTHQYRDRVVEGVRHVWVPSTAFFLPDELQDRVGEKVTGLGVIDLTRARAHFHLVCPEGVTRHSALDRVSEDGRGAGPASEGPGGRTEHITDRRRS
jgi:hypothetical protein